MVTREEYVMTKVYLKRYMCFYLCFSCVIFLVAALNLFASVRQLSIPVALGVLLPAGHVLN